MSELVNNSTNEVMPIEANFLQRMDVRQAIRYDDIQVELDGLKSNASHKFGISLQLANHLVHLNEWFKSDAAKELMAEEGIEWSKKEFVLKSTGISYTWFCKLIKAVGHDNIILKAYKKWAEMEQTTLSIECYNSFAKNVDLELIVDGALVDEMVDAIIEAVPIDEEAEVPASDGGVETIFTISFKCESGNVAARIDENGNLITTNSDAQILDAIAFLRSKLA